MRLWNADCKNAKTLKLSEEIQDMICFFNQNLASTYSMALRISVLPVITCTCPTSFTPFSSAPVLLLQAKHLSRWIWSYWGMTDSLSPPSNQFSVKAGLSSLYVMKHNLQHHWTRNAAKKVVVIGEDVHCMHTIQYKHDNHLSEKCTSSYR